MATHGETVRSWVTSRPRLVAAVATALVLLGGVTGAVVSDDGGKASETKVLSGTLTGPAPPAAPSTALPEPTTTSITTVTSVARTSGTTTTTRARPATTRAPATTSRPATTTSLPACRNSTDPACGPFRWEGTVVNQGMTLSLRWFPANPEVGQPVTFTLTMTDPDAPADGFFQSFGFEDGQALAVDDFPEERDRYGLWSLPPPKPGQWVDTYTHTYTRAGTFRAWFARSSRTPDLPGCVDEQRDLGDPWASSAGIQVWITVSPPSPGRAS